MTGYIYAIRCGDFVKIGFAVDPWRRLSQIRTASPYPCELLGFTPGTRAQEGALHIKYAALRHRGEWFRFECGVAEFARNLGNGEPRYDRRKGPRTPEVIARVVAGVSASKARYWAQFADVCGGHS